MIIMKFGGTSTQNASAMLNVTNIVKANLDKQPLVVISAIAQATNQLELMGNYAQLGDSTNAKVVLKNFLERHLSIVEEAVKTSDRRDELIKTINGFGAEIYELIQGTAIIRELTPKVLDKFYSYGELLSSLIISYIMKENGINTVWVDTKDFMITDDNFNRASPIYDIIDIKIKNCLHQYLIKGKTIVSQGFLGATINGDRTTMGRESSDFSAAIIGSALDAVDIQIWTDVDGILSGDPNIVENPVINKILTFEEAYELSLLGAKVLHPNTMLPAQIKNIPIHIYNSKRPEMSGTLIVNDSSVSISSPVKSITYKKKITLISVQQKVRTTQFVFWENILNIFTKYKIDPILTSTSKFKFCAVFDSISNIESLKHEMKEFGEISICENLTLISLVGKNILASKKFIINIFSELKHINVEYYLFGASNTSFSFLTSSENYKEAVKYLHKIIFEYSESNENYKTI